LREAGERGAAARGARGRDLGRCGTRRGTRSGRAGGDGRQDDSRGPTGFCRALLDDRTLRRDLRAMELSEEQFERYARHLILDEVGEEGQVRLLQSGVVVVGAVGLDSPLLLYL